MLDLTGLRATRVFDYYTEKVQVRQKHTVATRTISINRLAYNCNDFSRATRSKEIALSCKPRTFDQIFVILFEK